MKIARTILIFTLIISIVFVIGCEKNKNNEQEVYVSDEENPLMFKIVSERRTFNLDEEIRLTVAYGWIGYPEGNDNLVFEEPLNTIKMEYTISNVYLEDGYKRKEKNIRSIKVIDDFFTLKYKITPEYNSEHRYKKFTFSYYEDIVISQDLLQDEEGIVYFSISGYYDNNNGLGAFDSFDYKKENNQIIIDETLFKWKEQHGVEFLIKQ